MKSNYLIPGFLLLCFSLPGQDLALYFDFNSFALSDSSQQVLTDRLPEYRSSDSILITGYADTTGTDSYNLELSKKRAEVVQKWLLNHRITTPVKASWKGETTALRPYTGAGNRRTEVFCISKKTGLPKKEEQVFLINNLKDTIIQGKEGTRIKIPANSIVSSKGQADDEIIVSLTEYYRSSDIFLNNLTTRTNTDLLETNGMINLKIFKGKEICSIQRDKPIKIGFPAHGPIKDEMRLFYGKSNPRNEVIWEEPDDLSESSQPTFMLVEEMPTFRGGDINDFRTYACERLVYPQIAIDDHICGRVIIGFIVDENGLISEARIIRGAHSSLNREALRALNNTPPWIPGKQGNKNVRVQFVIPINFWMDDGCELKIDSLGLAEGAYPGIKDPSLRKSGINEIKYYVFESLSIGWLNCDQYARYNKPKSDLIVRIQEPGEISTHMLFTKSNSYLSGNNMNGVFYFNQLPRNEEVILLAFKKMNDKIFWAHKKITTGMRTESLENFEEITFDDLNASLDELRK